MSNRNTTDHDSPTEPAWLKYGHQRINQMDRTALDIGSEAMKLAEDQRQILLEHVRHQTQEAGPEPYRFEHGSLYEYQPDRRGYVHVYRSATAKTKAQAIREYQEVDHG